MKINRYFPPCPNCLSHLLILECSYESYQPLWPHLSFQFFLIQWQPLSSPHPCSTLDFASLWLHPGFLGPALLCSPDSECVVTLRLTSSPWSPSACSPWWFPPTKFLWSAKLSADPFLWEDSFAPTRPAFTELRALNLWLFPAGAFQPNWCCPITLVCLLGLFLLSPLFIRYSVLGSSLATSSCFASAYVNVT